MPTKLPPTKHMSISISISMNVSQNMPHDPKKKKTERWILVNSAAKANLRPKSPTTERRAISNRETHAFNKNSALRGKKQINKLPSRIRRKKGKNKVRKNIK